MIKNDETIGAVVISRNDGYGGDQPAKFIYCLTALLDACDEVIYVDWNSPGDVSLFDVVRDSIRPTGKLRVIKVSQALAKELLIENAKYQKHLIRPADTFSPSDAEKATLDAQYCVEALARNIGLRRLTTDFKISCNGDILCGSRESILEGILDSPHPQPLSPSDAERVAGRVFHCIARRETPFEIVRNFGPAGSETLRLAMRENVSRFTQHGSGSPLGPRDEWSLITCPGDFQMAHGGVWHAIRGFEEALVMRGYTDSNVQKKAALCGFRLELVRNIPAFHFGHYPGTGASGGTHNSGWNDPDKSLWNFTESTNPATWGFSEREFGEERV